MYRDGTVKKIEEIQYLLAQGKTRSEVAKALGYSNVSVLYRYASRNKLKWNAAKNNYEAMGNDGVPIEAVKTAEHVPTGKAANIISMFQSGMDGKDIAKKLRFTIQQMANYMRSQGYIWNEGKKNYIYQPQEIKEVPQRVKPDTSQTVTVAKQPAEMEAAAPNRLKEQRISQKGWEKHMDLLELLETHKDRLVQLLSVDNQAETLPRYNISGCLVPKNLRIANALDSLVKDYCSERNVSQQDLLQSAIIDFLKRYGFADRVKAQLKV